VQNLLPKFYFSNQFIKWFKSNPTIIIPHLPFNNICIIGINSWLKRKLKFIFHFHNTYSTLVEVHFKPT
jgi:hypothetical protein